MIDGIEVLLSEIRLAIKRLKKTPPGLDNILAELLKAGGETSVCQSGLSLIIDH